MPLQEQGSTISASAATSVSNILWLNETLQPWMSRDFMLAPFSISGNQDIGTAVGNWTASTLLYSVNVTCEEAVPYSYNSVTYSNSSWGCNYLLPVLRAGAADATNLDDTKLFDVLYVGYSDDNGAANDYLSDGACPPTESQTFYVQISKALIPPSQLYNMTADQQRANANYTQLWCRSNYFFTNATATISLPDHSVLTIQEKSEPQALPSNFFNVSEFEAAMSYGQELYSYRANFPTSSWPDQSPYLQNLPVNTASIGSFTKMASYAIGTTQLPMDAYLDPSNLANSYQAAYRLLFARQLADILSTDLDANAGSMGSFSYTTESIILVSSFVHIVEALLALAIVLASSLLFWSMRRPIRLQGDPSSLAAIMTLAAEDDGLQQVLRNLDRATEEQLYQTIKGYTFQLSTSDSNQSEVSIRLLASTQTDLRHGSKLSSLKNEDSLESMPETIGEHRKGFVRGILPYEFKLFTGFGFLIAQLSMFVVIGFLHLRISSRNGLSLPSQTRFVRQLLENYLPTAIGTLIGPFWLVLNRNICMLQPFEDLRKKRSTIRESIGANYTAIPPQLVVWKAFRKGHILLASLCLMTLLADVLSVSLAGLLFENTMLQPAAATFTHRYAMMFQQLNGSALPFDATFTPLEQLKGDVAEPFLMAFSNQTAKTSMPPWSDDDFFYLPFTVNAQQQNDTWNYRAVTPVVGAQLHCQPVPANTILNVTGTQAGPTGEDTVPSSANLTVLLPQPDGPTVTCVPRGPYPYLAEGAIDMEVIYNRPIGQSATEFAYGLDGCGDGEKMDGSGLTCSNNPAAAGALCRNHVAAGWIRGNLVNGISDDPSEIPSIITSWNATTIVCQAVVVVGVADVLVSADGHVLQTFSKNVSSDDIEKYFTTSPDDLIGQANQYILDNGGEWHNDSFPSDWTNYLIENAINSSLFLDPTQPPPAAEDVIPPFSALYSKLFAILLSRDMDLLLVKNTNTSSPIQGSIIRQEARIFMSKTMFLIAESILVLYMATTVALYIKRPWRILARMPTSTASVIAFFAASNALIDFKGTAGMTKRELSKRLGKVRYGFGTFIGIDGEPHIGIEKYPFIVPLTKHGNEDNSEQENEKWYGRWRRKIGYWSSGSVSQGGWI